MQHAEWNARRGRIAAAKKAKAKKAAAKVWTKAQLEALALRGRQLRGAYEEHIAWIMDHPEPEGWPDGAVRYSARERCYIMRDGSAVRPKAPHSPLPSTPEVRRRRRNYSEHLRASGKPGVYFPLTREEAEKLLPRPIASPKEQSGLGERGRPRGGLGEVSG